MEAIRGNISASLLPLLAIGCCILYILTRLSRVKRYPNEPPYIEPKFPIVGHVIGLLWKRYHYYVGLLSVSEFYTLDVL